MVFLVVTMPCTWQAHGAPSVFPTGLTVSNPAKAHAGYTLYGVSDKDKVFVLDMQGNEVHSWEVPGFWGLVKPLANGHILVFLGMGETCDTIRELDWDGKIVWEFTAGDEFYKLHHDFQRLANGNTLVLANKNRTVQSIAPREIKDDVIIELSSAGEIVWEWSVADHFEQLGLSDEAKQIIAGQTKLLDVFHTNSIQVLPWNWFEKQDTRFRHDNILVSQRNTNTVFIIEKATGNIVWRMGNTIAQHHAVMIPKGLLGAGHISIFDNGGSAGYPTLSRLFSRVLQVNPVSQKISWSYSPDNKSDTRPIESFFSTFRCSAQPLANGNVLIGESAWGRIVEVTREGEIVWEYLNPYFRPFKNDTTNLIYRAYRVDYTWPEGATGPGTLAFPW
jgi:hypothetical protein